MDAIKILHVNAEMGWAGGENQMHYLVRLLRDRGHQQVVACQAGSVVAKRFAGSGIEVRTVRMTNELSVSSIFGLRRIMKTGDFQIVHFHTSRAHALGALAALGAGPLRCVVTRRMEHRTGGWWKARVLYNRGADAVAAISESVGKVLVAAGVHQEKLRVIPDGVDVSRFMRGDGRHWRDRLGLPGDAPVIGTVATLIAKKSIETLLRAGPAILDEYPACRILVVGDGPRQESLQRMTVELGLSQNVVFAGFHEDIPGVLAAMDVFIMPSLQEGLGVAVLEAMAAGKPVIASRVGGLPESVVDGETGFLVAPGDHEALSRSLLVLLGNQALCERFGRAGRERVQARFSAEKMAQQYEALYQDLLGTVTQ